MSFRIVCAALLAVVAIGCGGSSSSPAPAPTPTPTPAPTPSPSGGTAASIVAGASTMTTSAYSPNPIVVATGGTVTWTNNDSTPHTSTGNGGSWDSGAIAPGGSFSRTFPAAGTFPYHCAFHPGMVGTVTVQ